MKICIAVDLSDESRCATRWALDLRDRRREDDKPVEIVALSVALATTWYSSMRDEKTTDEPGLHHQMTFQIREFLESVDPNVDDVEIVIDEGQPAEKISQYCKDTNVDWLVVGMSGLGRVGRFMLGSTVHDLADEVPSKMAIVHPEHCHLRGSLDFMLGMDFLPDSDNALLTAAELADETGANLHLVHAFPDLPANSYSTGLVNYIATDNIDHTISTARTAMENMMADVQQRYPNLAYHTHVEAGVPEKVLINYSKDIGADAAILGKVYHSTFHKWLLGSVSRGILKKMPTTLIFVPPDQ